jgi:hypothetical protein
MPSNTLKFLQKEIILPTIPDHEFICVLGTSHTYGQCHLGKSYRLDNREIWTSHIERYTGIPVLNFGVRGISNEDMTMLLIELLKIDKFKNNCKHVITENRVMENNFAFDFKKHYYSDEHEDYIRDDIKLSDDFIYFPIYVKSCMFENSDMIDALDYKIKYYEPTHRFPLYPGEGTSRNTEQTKKSILGAVEQVNRVITNKNNPYKLSDTELNMMLNYFMTHNELWKYSMAHIMNDLKFISTMNMMCSLANIPYNWFCWDNYMQKPYFTDDVVAQSTIDNISNIVDVFDYELTNMRGGSRYRWFAEMPDWPEECDCGHQGASYHEYVANKVIENIREGKI